MEGALAGIRVLDLTHYIAGPFCTRLLADHGAEVIKIEKPGEGEGARRMGPFVGDDPHPEKSIPFLYLNWNKKGITLNLKAERGRELFRALVREADVLVENFEPRVMPGLGLSYTELQQINPALIMTSISNFGQTGPYRDYKAQDLILYAMSGIMSISGRQDREPIKHGLFQAQYAGGINGALTTVLALYIRELWGRGQHIDVSIAECLTSELVLALPYYTYTGGVQGRMPPQGGAFGNIMPCQDGYVVAQMGVGTRWEDFVDFLDIPELRDPKFATAEGRIRHGAELDALLVEKFRKMKKWDLYHTASQRRFLFGVVQDPAELSRCPHLEARNFFREITHQVVGSLRYPAELFKMTETPAQFRRGAPLLGEHNEEIYEGLLGLSASEREQLQAEGVI
ncbi:MAG: CoA transferase [Nitrospinota bacterium]|nr:MAG: CoA transferase [Nitrospinota bacterium]